MLRRSVTAGLFLVLAAMFTFVGCSDDNTPSGPAVGDPNSVQFQPLKTAISTAVDSTLGVALKFAYKPNRFPSDVAWERPDMGPNDSLFYNFVGGWNILYLGLTASADHNFTYVDSARFWEGEEAVWNFRDYASTGVDLIHHQSTLYSGTSEEYTDQTIYVNVSFHNWNLTSRSFSGHVKLELDDHTVESGTQQNVNYDMSVTADNITFERATSGSWTQSHATGGEVTIVTTVDDGTNSVEWNISVGFNANGQAQVEATDGMTVYSYTATPAYQ